MNDVRPGAPQAQGTGGGCDFRYQGSSCAWGTAPDHTVVALGDLLVLPGAMVLDAGCGEGRNAVYLAGRGALVHAVDVSATALANGRAQWPDDNGVTWQQADLTRMPLPAARYDAVIACSVLHWLAGEAAVERLFSRLRQAVKPGGLHALVVFNDRLPYPEDTAPSQPTLLAHDWYLERYAGWHLAAVADRDSTHTHPGDSAPHAHAISRIIARRPEEAAGERPARHDDQSGGQASDG